MWMEVWCLTGDVYVYIHWCCFCYFERNSLVALLESFKCSNIYIHMYAYTCAHIHTYIHIHIYIYTCVYAHIYTYAHTLVRTYTPAYWDITVEILMTDTLIMVMHVVPHDSFPCVAQVWRGQWRVFGSRRGSTCSQLPWYPSTPSLPLLFLSHTPNTHLEVDEV